MSEQSLSRRLGIIPIDHLDPDLLNSIEQILDKRQQRDHLKEISSPDLAGFIGEKLGGNVSPHVLLHFMVSRQEVAGLEQDLVRVWAEVYEVIAQRLKVDMRTATSQDMMTAVGNLYPESLDVEPRANSQMLLLEISLQELRDNPDAYQRYLQLVRTSIQELGKEADGLTERMTGNKSLRFIDTAIRINSLLQWSLALRSSLEKLTAEFKDHPKRPNNLKVEKSNLDRAFAQIAHLFIFISNELPDSALFTEISSTFEIATNVFDSHEPSQIPDNEETATWMMGLLKIYRRNISARFKENQISEEEFIEHVIKILSFLDHYLQVTRGNNNSLQQIVTYAEGALMNLGRTLYGDVPDAHVQLFERLGSAPNKSFSQQIMALIFNNTFKA